VGIHQCAAHSVSTAQHGRHPLHSCPAHHRQGVVQQLKPQGATPLRAQLRLQLHCSHD
jgi:hypothetical protein